MIRGEMVGGRVWRAFSLAQTSGAREFGAVLLASRGASHWRVQTYKANYSVMVKLYSGFVQLLKYLYSVTYYHSRRDRCTGTMQAFRC